MTHLNPYPIIRVALVAPLIILAQASILSADDFFRDRVAPILTERCLSCHSGDDPKGGFSLESRANLLEDGYVEPGDAAASHLMELIAPTAGPAEMPRDAAPLSAPAIAVIAQWIDDGAQWPSEFELRAAEVDDFDWWSYRPLTRPAVPPSDDPWANSAIDRFVLAGLNEQGLTHSPPAERATLIRRLTYDLTGLPPTPEEVDAFIADSDPQAYEKLVDRLLESKHYGEHWARHWLDVVKYADSCGYDKDKLRPNAWPYRDYVIRSFNDDKPYARFVQEQIAGDVLFPDDPDGIVGLGFIAAGPWDFIGHVEVAEDKLDGKVARNLDRDDMVSGAFNTFCSLTVQCARCHNHKFDPITQEQYYGIQAVFAAVDRADRQFDRDPATARLRRELVAQRNELVAEQSKLDGQIASLDANPSTGGQAALSEQIVEQQGELASRLTALQAQIGQLPAQQTVYAATTGFERQGNFIPTDGKPREIFVLIRGEVGMPGKLAAPGVIPLSGDAPWQFDSRLSEAERRAELARWLTEHHNPLVWRSIVNRVWQYHFGDGIVATPNDFGRMGAEPTHPELLDWLAIEFRDGGRSLTAQSMKSLHRMIVTSNTYRQSSANIPENASIDGGNQYLWRANRRRLTAEELRDSILVVSGAMDWQMGGPGYYLFELEKPEHSPHFEYFKFDPSEPASHRRSIYRFVARSQPNPYMTTLDCADSSQSTPKRTETLTSLQALALLNNKFNLAMARQFAQRLERDRVGVEGQVARAVELVTQRTVTTAETNEYLDYRRKHGLNNLCRLLFNLSEFVFLD